MKSKIYINLGAWLSGKEVCEAMRICPKTLYRYVKKGYLPEGKRSYGSYGSRPPLKRWKYSDVIAAMGKINNDRIHKHDKGESAQVEKKGSRTTTSRSFL